MPDLWKCPCYLYIRGLPGKLSNHSQVIGKDLEKGLPQPFGYAFQHADPSLTNQLNVILVGDQG